MPGCSHQIKIPLWVIGEIDYGSISRLKFGFCLDDFGVLVQLDLEIMLKKKLCPIENNLFSSFFL